MSRTCSPPVEKQRLLDLLDTAHARSVVLPFWWRDDDAETVTPQLERLLALAARFDLPLGLAVVPKRATAELAARIARAPNTHVLQHGWSHHNHSPPDEKKAELRDHRPADAIAGELRMGFERLSRLFPQKFLPVLAPPWNRIGEATKAAMRPVGLVGLSTFGPADPGEPHRANVHLDIFTWRPARHPLSLAEAYAVLAREILRRLDGDAPVHRPQSGGGEPRNAAKAQRNPFSRREKVSPKAADEGVPRLAGSRRKSPPAAPPHPPASRAPSPSGRRGVCLLRHPSDGPPPPSQCDGGGTYVPPKTEPIGIMTHHLVHTDESWTLLDELFASLRAHPAISWPAVPAIFGLTPCIADSSANAVPAI